jgi:AcrR family transcriptional regulator
MEMTKPKSASSQPSLRVDQIVEATRTLFVRYGYRRTSVDDIAREAGIAKATLYLHFAGKEDVFQTMLSHFRAMINDRCDVAESFAGPVEVQIVELLYAYYGSMLEWFGDAAHLNELKIFAAQHVIGPIENPIPAFRSRLRRVLDHAVDRHEIVPAQRGLSIDDVARTLLYAATGAKLAQKHGASQLRRALEQLVTLIISSVRPV